MKKLNLLKTLLTINLSSANYYIVIDQQTYQDRIRILSNNSNQNNQPNTILSAKGIPYTVTQNVGAYNGRIGSYDNFNNGCETKDSNGLCQKLIAIADYQNIGANTVHGLNPTYTMKYSEPVSISMFEFAGYIETRNQPGYTSPEQINFKYKDLNGNWQIALNIVNEGHINDLYLQLFTLPNPIISDEFAIEAITVDHYFQIGYYSVVE